jgi:glycosyltransferase involved in cell wall biosynthesis
LPLLQAAGYPVNLFGFYGQEGAPVRTDGGLVILPRVAQPFGNDIVSAYVDMTGSRVVITLIDAHALDPAVYSTFPTIMYTPVDCTPANPATVTALKGGARWVWTMSAHGMSMLQQAGLKPTYVPHGIDLSVFKPGDQQAARKALAAQTAATIPDDAFLVDITAANKGTPSRKGFFEGFKATSVLMARHPNVYLYCHTEISGIYNGEDLIKVVDLCGLPRDRVIFPSQAHLVSGQLTPGYMATAYQAGDVFLSAAHGEGFGVPIVEAQACGLPVVVPDNTAQRELAFTGWKVPTMTYMPFAGLTWERPLVDGLVEGLEQAYQTRGQWCANAVAGVQHFDHKRVFTQYMQPALEAVCAELDAEQARQRVFILPAVCPEPTTRPDVSVLMPVYKISTYPLARQAVDSALNQEGVTVQVVMVDDGSDDDTMDILNQWAADDPRIVVARCDRRDKPPLNGHLHGNIPPNLAAKRAAGRYFIWGSTRAWYEPGAFAALVDTLDSNPGVGFAYGATQYHGNRTDLYRPGPFDAAAFKERLVSLQAYMYRREAWDDGLRYRGAFDFLYPSDHDFALQLIADKGWRGLCIPETTYHYLLESGTMTERSVSEPGMQTLWDATWRAAVCA